MCTQVNNTKLQVIIVKNYQDHNSLTLTKTCTINFINRSFNHHDFYARPYLGKFFTPF